MPETAQIVSRLEEVERGLVELRESMVRVESEVLGEVGGGVGMRQKTDMVYETLQEMRFEHKEMRAFMGTQKQSNALRQGIMLGAAAVGGGGLMELIKHLKVFFP